MPYRIRKKTEVYTIFILCPVVSYYNANFSHSEKPVLLEILYSSINYEYIYKTRVKCSDKKMSLSQNLKDIIYLIVLWLLITYNF